MTRLRLNSGDTLCGDQLRLTLAGLAKSIGTADEVFSLSDALQSLPPELSDTE
jgi:hypothetical protein